MHRKSSCAVTAAEVRATCVRIRRTVVCTPHSHALPCTSLQRTPCTARHRSQCTPGRTCSQFGPSQRLFFPNTPSRRCFPRSFCTYFPRMHRTVRHRAQRSPCRTCSSPLQCFPRAGSRAQGTNVLIVIVLLPIVIYFTLRSAKNKRARGPSRSSGCDSKPFCCTWLLDP